MSTSDLNEPSGVSARRRKRQNTALLVLAAGIFLFAAAAGGLYYALRPVTLRIAVGPPGSDDQKLVQALAQIFSREASSVRLSPITTEGATESIAVLAAGKADLAVARGDLDLPANAESAAILLTLFVTVTTAASTLDGLRNSASMSRSEAAWDSVIASRC